MKHKAKEKVIVNGKRQRKIIYKIAALLLVEVLILTAFLEYLSISKVREATSATLIQSYDSLVLAQSANVLNRNSKFYQQMRMYSHADVTYNNGKHVDPEVIWEWLRAHASVRSYDFEDVYYCDAETGIAKSDTGKEMNIKDTVMYKKIMEENLTQYISEPVGTCATDSIYYICKSVTKNKKIVGIFIVTINYETLVRSIAAMKVGETGFAILLTGDGTVMAFPPDDSYVLNVNAFKDEKRLGFEGLSEVATDMIAGNNSYGWISQNGKRYLMIYAPIRNVTWYIALVIPEAEIYNVVNVLRNRMIVIGILIALVLVVTISLSIAATIKPLRILDKNIRQIATGEADLTQRLPISGHDEIASVTESFNLFVAKLHDIMAGVKGSKDNLHDAGIELKGGIEENSVSVDAIMDSLVKVNGEINSQRGSVQNTAGAVNEIASNISSLENMIETQSSGITEASSAVEQMIGNIANVNESVERMAVSFDELEEKAVNGNIKQTEMAEKIKLIAQQSGMLTEANKAIADIASQTNLLSMNAAIEAAHAGEAGKGFSVVAEEIRKLAETSSEQSKRIGKQLKSINVAIDSVVETSVETKETFDNVAASIRETDRIVHMIKDAMAEQNHGSHQIVSALKDMSNSSMEVRNASKEMAQGNKAILDGVKNLEGMTLEIQNTMEDVRENARNISKTGTTLNSISENMGEAIITIGSQIDNFQV